jgi:hypothetical protein
MLLTLPILEVRKVNNSSGRSARLGAASYVIWSLLHFETAWAVYQLANSMPASMAQARVLQDAWNLACFSIAGIGVAIFLNWRNERCGYWINLGVISVADIGFVAFVLLPGLIPMWPGLLGPLFWIVGLMLTTIAQLSSSRR